MCRWPRSTTPARSTVEAVVRVHRSPTGWTQEVQHRRGPGLSPRYLDISLEAMLRAGSGCSYPESRGGDSREELRRGSPGSTSSANNSGADHQGRREGWVIEGKKLRKQNFN